MSLQIPYLEILKEPHLGHLEPGAWCRQPREGPGSGHRVLRGGWREASLRRRWVKGTFHHLSDSKTLVSIC